MGRRTSVYLSDDLAAAVTGSGIPLGELIRRGLGARPETPGEIEAKVTTARQAREPGQAIARERRTSPAQRHQLPSHAVTR
ncbi:MAG: hypothetical protein ACRDOK_23660 [Streptosporangiaceae bacterium]